jgi:hypothetical protein
MWTRETVVQQPRDPREGKSLNDLDFSSIFKDVEATKEILLYIFNVNKTIINKIRMIELQK